MYWPCATKRITSNYGVRGGGYHNGTDFAPEKTNLNRNLYAVVDGVISVAKCDGSGLHKGYGYYIVVDQVDGYSTLYAHLADLEVKVGQTVKVGQRIGKMGLTGRTTGLHLHFEARTTHYNSRYFDKNADGSYKNSIDPVPYLAQLNKKTNWYDEVVAFVQDKKIMIGDETGFRPNDFVTRAELAQVVERLLKK